MTMVLVIDCETDGLFGALVAVGGVLVNHDGVRLGAFGGYVTPRLRETENEWVRTNVARHAEANEERPGWLTLRGFEDEASLMEAFCAWAAPHCASAEVYVDCGFPVEHRCLAPYAQRLTGNGQSFVVIHDIATVIAMVHRRTDLSRAALGAVGRELHDANEHNPVWDSWVSYCALNVTVSRYHAAIETPESRADDRNQ